MTTPEHNASFVGRFVYIYKGKGSLTLTEDKLIFIGKSSTTEIPVIAIHKIDIGHYSRFAKPIRLDYLAVTYRTFDQIEVIMFTPTNSWRTPVWKTNKCVSSWVELLNFRRKDNASCVAEQSV